MTSTLKSVIGKEVYNELLNRWCKPTSFKNGKVRVKYSGNSGNFFSEYLEDEFLKMLRLKTGKITFSKKPTL